MKYAVLFEQTATGFSAHVPDLPGCVAAGATLAETTELIRHAIRMHLDGMREDGEPIPESEDHRRIRRGRLIAQIVQSSIQSTGTFRNWSRRRAQTGPRGGCRTTEKQGGRSGADLKGGPRQAPPRRRWRWRGAAPGGE